MVLRFDKERSVCGNNYDRYVESKPGDWYQESETHYQTTAPNTTFNSLIGFLVGVVIALLIITAVELTF